MQSAFFEAERTPAESQVEEVDDFDFLISEIRESSREDAQARMGVWLDRFERAWANDPDQWSMLVELLPRPADLEPSIAKFRQLLLSTTREPTAADVFFANPSIASKLSAYAWTDFLGAHATGLVAGCLNVARAASQSGSPSSTLMGILSTTVANYPLTLIGIGLNDPSLVTATPDGCSLGDALDVSRERFGRWSFDQSIPEVRTLLASFEPAAWLQVLRALLGQEELSATVLAPFAKATLDADDERLAAVLATLAFESPELSATMKERALSQTGDARAAALALWARYLSLDDAFTFAWECIKPGTADAPPVFGDALEGRLKQLEHLLRIPSTLGSRAQFDGRAEWSWRDPALRAMAAIGALAARKWTARDDQIICEDEAVAAFAAFPDLLGKTVAGLLDHAQEHRDALDALILRLPKDRLVPVLSSYVDTAAVWSESKHRAARLLSQVKGEAVLGERAETAPAPAENLPEPSRERKPLASQTWLGDGTMERLWHVALEVAQTRFDEAMAERFAEDKDEHCAALAEVISRSLNGTNSALKMWLKWNGAAPPVIKASVRRSPPKVKRAAGALQADLAILIKCNVAGKCVTKRITPFRVKKLAPSTTSDSWPNHFKVPGAERTSLTRFLTLSAATHYLFIMPRILGESLRVLPAALVRDMVASQGFGGSIPVSTIAQAGLRLPEFILFHVLSLWTGDDDADLIAKAGAEAEPDQSPHVVLEINVSREEAK